MKEMKRTTVRIEPYLYKRASKHAIDNDMSFQDVVNKGLYVLLDEQKTRQTKKKKSLFEGIPTVNLGIGNQVIDRDFIYGEPSIDNIR